MLNIMFFFHFHCRKLSCTFLFRGGFCNQSIWFCFCNLPLTPIMYYMLVFPLVSILSRKCCKTLERTEINNAQKMKFSVKDFSSKCDQIRRKSWIWSYFPKKSFMENFIFFAIKCEYWHEMGEVQYVISAMPQKMIWRPFRNNFFQVR